MITIGIAAMHDEVIVVNMLRKMFSNSHHKLNVIEFSNFQRSDLSASIINDYIFEIEKNKSSIAIIKILPDIIDTGLYDDIRFNILVYGGEDADLEKEISNDKIKHYKNLFKKVHKEDICIINVDDSIALELLKDSNMGVITYGLDSKATITTSSIEQDSDKSTFIYCLQRNITSIDKKNIEPQEFPINVFPNQDNITYTVLAAATVALICDVHVKDIQDIVL